MNGRQASSRGQRLCRPRVAAGARYGRGGSVRRLEEDAAHATVGSWLSTSGVGRRPVVGAGLPRADLTAVGCARPRTGLRGGHEASHGPGVERAVDVETRVGCQPRALRG